MNILCSAKYYALTNQFLFNYHPYVIILLLLWFILIHNRDITYQTKSQYSNISKHIELYIVYCFIILLNLFIVYCPHYLC